MKIETTYGLVLKAWQWIQTDRKTHTKKNSFATVAKPYQGSTDVYIFKYLSV